MSNRPFGLRFVAPLALASVLNPINASLISTALVPIGQALGATAVGIGWLIVGLYIASAVAQPAMGRLADLVGPRTTLVAALGLVACAGVFDLLVASLPLLIATRVLIGIGTAAAYPSAMRMFRDRGDALGTPAPRTAMAVLALSSQTVVAIGPLLGSLLTSAFGWRAVFVANLPVALAAMSLILLWAPPDRPRDRSPSEPRPRFDVLGLILFAAFLTSAMLVLMRLADPDWHAVAAAVVFAIALGVWSWRREDLFLDVPMLACNAPLRRTYGRFMALMTIAYRLFYSFPQSLQAVGRYSPEASGLMTIPMSLIAAAASLAAARTRLIRAAFLLACGGALAGSVALRLLGHAAPAWLLAAGVVPFGFTLGIASTATQAALDHQAPRERLGRAAGLQRSFGYLGSMSSAGLLALAFDPQPSDAGFHTLMTCLIALSSVLLLVVGLDRTLDAVDRA